MPEDVIQAIKNGDQPQLSDAGDQAAYAMTNELIQTKGLANNRVQQQWHSSAKSA